MLDYTKQTSQDWLIIETWVSPTDDKFIICRRKGERSPICWGAFYNDKKGYWNYGHYDYESLEDARRDMLNMYLNKYKLKLIK